MASGVGTRMSDHLISCVWVAAILYGRQHPRTSPEGHWDRVHDLTEALGFPQYPYEGCEAGNRGRWRATRSSR